jgi:hypothetical protein
LVVNSTAAEKVRYTSDGLPQGPTALSRFPATVPSSAEVKSKQVEKEPAKKTEAKLNGTA